MTANVNVTKVLFKRGNTAQNAAYTGINGEITVDTQAKTLRVHDGVTTGGNIVTAGAIASYLPTDPTITSIQANVAAANAAISAITGIDTSLLANAATQQTQIDLINANVAAANALIPNLSAVSGNIIPGANVTYSLGSEQFQWRDLWVSNNTIYIGNTPVRVDGSTLLVNGAPVGGGATGDITFTNTTMSPPDGEDIIISAASGQVDIQALDFRVVTTDDVRITGNDVVSLRNLSTTEPISIFTDYNGSAYGWEFNADGTLTAPGDIVVSGDVTGTVGASTLTLLAQPDSNTYIQLNNSVDSVISTVANLEIRTDVSNTAKTWEFDTTGNLTFPDSSFILDSIAFMLGARDDLIIRTDSAGVQNDWIFGADGGLTLPNGATIKDAGNSVAFGQDAGIVTQGEYSVAIGFQAGADAQGNNAIAIGESAGTNTQGVEAIAIGYNAGTNTQGNRAVAISIGAGQTGQGEDAIAIGYNAGTTSQTEAAVAIGRLAGQTSQSGGAVAIGSQAGADAQSVSAVAIGSQAGENSQGQYAVAIGDLAGATSQGIAAVAIGALAGQTSQGNNSIIINATNAALDQITANTFTVKPIRSASTGNVLYYNTSSGEITYEAGSFVYGNTEVQAYLQELSSINFTASPASISGVQNMVMSNANVTSSLIAGSITATGNITQQSAYYETYANVANSGGNLTCNFVDGATFYAALTANVTVNFANVVATAGRATGATIIVDQGATPYSVANIQINGGGVQTVKWAGGTTNTGTASNTDIMSFSLISLDGTNWRILGQIANYA